MFGDDFGPPPCEDCASLRARAERAERALQEALATIATLQAAGDGLAEGARQMDDGRCSCGLASCSYCGDVFAHGKLRAGAAAWDAARGGK
jgi:hypothetical protein